MALPTFVAAGGIAVSTTTITPSLPGGIATDDILFLPLETQPGQVVTIANAAGGTWTQSPDSPQDTGGVPVTGTRLTVFWSRYNGTQTAPTTDDPGNHVSGRMSAFRGCITTGDPFDVTSGGNEATEDTSVSVPGDTTTVADCLVVIFVSDGFDPASSNTAHIGSWANADLANITERTDDSRTVALGGGLATATGEKATVGAYGATTATLTDASAKSYVTIALKPPSGAGFSELASTFAGTSPSTGRLRQDHALQAVASREMDFGPGFNLTNTGTNPLTASAAGTSTFNSILTNKGFNELATQDPDTEGYEGATAAFAAVITVVSQGTTANFDADTQVSIQLALNANPLDAEPLSWTDVAPYCRAFSIRRGASRGLGRVEAGNRRSEEHTSELQSQS